MEYQLQLTLYDLADLNFALKEGLLVKHIHCEACLTRHRKVTPSFCFPYKGRNGVCYRTATPRPAVRPRFDATRGVSFWCFWNAEILFGRLITVDLLFGLDWEWRRGEYRHLHLAELFLFIPSIHILRINIMPMLPLSIRRKPTASRSAEQPGKEWCTICHDPWNAPNTPCCRHILTYSILQRRDS